VASDSRYEMLETVGAGSFATVYRAKDTELGREVAIKQIHDQYLQMPEQMERYWQEAQLLAQLQHPNIITFFDIDRERGWLIMELMQGNLADRISTEPLDLKSVRTSLAHCLRALKYLHSQGIVHGDVKPGNMMIDSRKRIKIGDFGLSRRVSDEDGSLLKGTTKYMAPEVMSEDFGEVGPSSDLYSLGFAAYELMCGPNFESLFPGLNAFGRDRQVGWMMWHAAADRKLPEISRVLEGVPDDLAHVVQKLVSKDQSQRYQTASEALSELQIDIKIVKTGHDAPLEETGDPTRRNVAIAAFCGSLILCLLMLFLPGNDDNEKKIADTGAPVEGVVGHVDADKGFFTITGSDGHKQEVKIGNTPKILLNEKTYITPRDMRPDDRVVIRKTTTDDGRLQLAIAVSRPDESIGYLTAVFPNNEQLTLQITEGSKRGELTVRATETTRIELNGKRALLEELKPDDLVTVRHVPDPKLDASRAATEIIALQKRRLDGFLRDVLAASLTIEVNRQGKTVLIKLPIAEECAVTVNGKKIVEGRILKPGDLEAGDRVTLLHHSDIIEVNALRQFLHTGKLLELQSDSSTLIVSDGDADRKVFVVDAECSITVNGQPAQLSELRRDDKVELSYDSTAEQNDVDAIDALRPVNENRFAIVIGIQNYDDNSLSKLAWSASDAKVLHETLLNRYACGPDNTLLLVDETRVRIEQAVPDWLLKTDIASEVIVFFAGHAYVDDEGLAGLAAKDFDLSRVTESGISLSWLREQLEACPAREKLLLLDCSRAGEGVDQQRQLSAARMIESLKPEKDPAEFRTTWAIASSTADQRGQDWAEKQHGLFGWFVAEAYSGTGDGNQDVHLEPTELFDYLRNEMAQVTIDDQSQLPKLFRPDATPPEQDRLSPAAKDAIRKLLATYWAPGTRRGVPVEGQADYLTASRLAGDEPDAQLTWALIQHRNREDKEAQKHFERVKLSSPELLLPYEALAWLKADQRHYSESFSELTTLLQKLRGDDPAEAPVFDDNARRVMVFAARIREFAVTIPDSSRQPPAISQSQLDKAVAAFGDEAVAVYEAARTSVTDKVTDYDTQLAAAKGTNQATLIELERKRIEKYVTFDATAARQAIVARLDED
jgi:tRNA A-37 threonylcarbamoyl transferase component Bud32